MKGVWIYPQESGQARFLRISQMAFFLLMPVFLQAAEPPAYAPEPTVKALNAAVESCGQGLSSIQTTPVEPARAALLKKSVDQLVDGAARSAEAGRSLSLETQAPISAASAVVKGKSGAPSLDSRTEAAVGSARALRRQWSELSQEVERALSDLEKQSSKLQGLDPKKQAETARKREERKEALEDWQERLKNAERPLAEIDSLLGGLGETGSTAKSNAAAMERVASELEAASSALAKTAASLQQAGPQAKQSIDALGSPPENVARTRVYQKLEPLIDGQRSVYVSGDVARNRANSFSGAYSAFIKSWKNYEALHKDVSQRLSGMTSLLSSAAAGLSRLKSETL